MKRYGSKVIQMPGSLALVSALTLFGIFACSEPPGIPSGTGGGVGQTGDGDVTPDDPAPNDGVSRFRRLTHAQWAQTVVDLFELDEVTDLATSFRADPTQNGYIFVGNGDALEVDQALWSSYQGAALALAEQVAGDDDILAHFLPSGFDDEATEAQIRSFIEDFGARVHRRPLSTEQVDAYLALYEQGLDSYADLTGYRAGLRLLLEGFLQSPYFVYRVEESLGEPGESIPLDGYERASRLSYFLWGTMPDEILFDAAGRGDLDDTEGVRAEALRLINDPRAASVFVDFFERVLDVERYETIAPSTTVFPDIGENLREAALAETGQFIMHEMFEKSGSLRDLLLSTTTYVNDDLAAIYGLEGDFDETFSAATLDPAQRRGVLTQVGFLAAHATSRDPDPIHRGVFLARRINCMTVSAPPVNVPPLPPSVEEKSNRQLVADHTEDSPVCAECHALIINPFGFSYENYDAVGAYRTQDGIHPVDAAAEVSLDDGQVAVNDAVELAEALAASRGVHECMSGHLISFALGRPRGKGDQELVTELGALSLGEAVPFADLMVEMSVAVVSLNRAPEAQ